MVKPITAPTLKPSDKLSFSLFQTGNEADRGRRKGSQKRRMNVSGRFKHGDQQLSRMFRKNRWSVQSSWPKR